MCFGFTGFFVGPSYHQKQSQGVLSQSQDRLILLSIKNLYFLSSEGLHILTVELVIL